MYRTLKNHLNPASLLAVVAIFMAMGGVSYAAATKIGTKDIKKAAVTTAKLKNDAVTGAKVKESSLGQVPKAAQATSADSATKAATATNAEQLGGIPAASFGSGVVGAAITAPPVAAMAPSVATGAPIGVGEFQMPVPVPIKVKNLTVRAVGDFSRPFVLSLRKPGGQALTCGGAVICTVPGPVSFQPGELMELAVTVPPGPAVFTGATYQVGYQIVP
ncbi:MAG TPA: hypothetical protein VFB52_09590 [Solirubrobacterales bacterium]|nr:hypothetical protein [Solirubrobacterales bacterium]